MLEVKIIPSQNSQYIDYCAQRLAQICSLNRSERRLARQETEFFLDTEATKKIFNELIKQNTAESLQKAILLFKYFVVEDLGIKKIDKIQFLDDVELVFHLFFEKIDAEISLARNAEITSWVEIVDNFPEYFDVFIRYVKLRVQGENSSSLVYQKIISFCTAFRRFFIKLNNPTYVQSVHHLVCFLGKQTEQQVFDEYIDQMKIEFDLMYQNSVNIEFGLNNKRLHAIYNLLEEDIDFFFPSIDDFSDEIKAIIESVNEESINVLLQKYTNIAYFLIYKNISEQEKDLFFSLSVKLYSALREKIEQSPLMIKCCMEYISLASKLLRHRSVKKISKNNMINMQIELSEGEKEIFQNAVIEKEGATEWELFIKNWEGDFNFFDKISPGKYIWIQFFSDWYKAADNLESVAKRERKIERFLFRYKGTLSQNISAFYDLAISYTVKRLKLYEEEDNQVAFQRWAGVFEATFIDFFNKKDIEFERKARAIDNLYSGFVKFSKIFVSQDTDWYLIIPYMDLYEKVIFELTDHYIKLIEWSSYAEADDSKETLYYKIIKYTEGIEILKNLAQVYIDFLKVRILLEPDSQNKKIPISLKVFQEKVQTYKEAKLIIETEKEKILAMQAIEPVLSRSHLISNMYQLSLVLASHISNDRITFEFEVTDQDLSLRDFIMESNYFYSKLHSQPVLKETEGFIEKLQEQKRKYEAIDDIQCKAIAQILIRIHNAFVKEKELIFKQETISSVIEKQSEEVLNKSKQQKLKKKRQAKKRENQRAQEQLRKLREKIGSRNVSCGIIDSKESEQEEGEKEEEKEEAKQEDALKKSESSKPSVVRKKKKRGENFKKAEKKEEEKEEPTKFYVPAEPSSIENYLKSVEEVRKNLNHFTIEKNYLRYALKDCSPIKLPHTIVDFLKQLEERGTCALIVGGSIRDFLRGKEKCHDIDIIADCNETDLREIFKKHFSEELKRNENVSIVNLYSCQKLAFNITLKPRNFNLLKDAQSRDFECNALYVNYEKKIIDPLKIFRKVKEGKTIETIGAPIEKLSEDPIRILRGIGLQEKERPVLSAAVAEAITKTSYKLSEQSLGVLKHHLCRLFLNGNAAKNFEGLEEFNLFPYLFAFVRCNDYWHGDEILKEFIKGELIKQDYKYIENRRLLKEYKENPSEQLREKCEEQQSLLLKGGELMALLLLPAALYKGPIPEHYRQVHFFSEKKLQHYIKINQPPPSVISHFEVHRGRGRGNYHHGQRSEFGMRARGQG